MAADRPPEFWRMYDAQEVGYHACEPGWRNDDFDAGAAFEEFAATLQAAEDGWSIVFGTGKPARQFVRRVA